MDSFTGNEASSSVLVSTHKIIVSENLLMVDTQTSPSMIHGVVGPLGIQLAGEELHYFVPPAPVNSCSMWIAKGGVEDPHGGVLPDRHTQRAGLNPVSTS